MNSESLLDIAFQQYIAISIFQCFLKKIKNETTCLHSGVRRESSLTIMTVLLSESGLEVCGSGHDRESQQKHYT